MKGAAAKRAGRWVASVFLAALWAGPSGPARAEEATRLEPIVVTATRMEEKVSEQASSVSVVTLEEIGLKSPALVGDVMRDLPGVVVQRSGSPGNLENIRIRGGKSTHTLVLIDGFPVNSPTTGEFDIGHLPADGFERVEVVRGAQSALYGSNAMGGVVNFIPRKGGEGPRYGAGLAGGSFGALRGNGFAAGTGGRGNFFLQAGGYRSDGFLPNDGTDIASFLGTGSVEINSANHLHVIALTMDSTKEIPIDFGDPRDLQHVNIRRARMAGVRWEAKAARFLTFTAYGDVYHERFDVNDPDPGTLFGFDSFTKTWKTTVGLLGRFSLGRVSTTFIGVEYQKDRATNRFTSATGAFPPSILEDSIINRSIYLQEELRMAESSGLSLGTRFDANSVAGHRFTPRGAAFHTFRTAGIKVRAAVGKGFRAPAILEKTDPDAGNISLTSERAISYEVGADWTLPGKKGTLSATYFYQDFRGMIQFDNKVTFRLANVDALARGVEAEAGYRFRPELGLLVGYTFTDTWDKSLQQRVLGVPAHRGDVALLIDPLPAWQSRVSLRIESDQLDAALFSGRTRRPGFAVVDAHTRYRLEIQGSETREMALTGKVQNLLNHRYEERLDNPSPGITFMIGAELKI